MDIVVYECKADATQYKYESNALSIRIDKKNYKVLAHRPCFAT
jgi:hypothetical protein